MLKFIINIITIFFSISFVLYTQDSIDYALEYLNNIREKYGLHLLESNEELNNIAFIRAKDLSINFSNNRPNNTRYDELLYKNGIIVFSSDENIAYRFKNIETVISYWMNSEEYKVNILSDKFTHIGISHYSANGEDFWAAIFVQLRRQ